MVRGHTPDLAWRLMDTQHWVSPRLARRQRVFVVADFGGQCSHEILFKPRTVQSISASGGNCGLPAACGVEALLLKQGGVYRSPDPFNAMAAPTRNEAERRLDFWLEACDHLNLPEFKSCRKMLANWRRYILNVFAIHLSNGFTEGCNNAIKTLKRPPLASEASAPSGLGFFSLQGHTPTFDKEPLFAISGSGRAIFVWNV